jgi:hypothetical protein
MFIFIIGFIVGIVALIVLMELGDSGFFDWFSRNDPVQNCELYRDEGCSHVDGYLCDFPQCKMLRNYREENY